MNYKFVAPNGVEITDIVSTQRVIERIDSFVPGYSPGKVDFEYAGDSDYDDAEPVERNGERVFEDANGTEWLESQCKLEPVLDEEWYAEQAATLVEDGKCDD